MSFKVSKLFGKAATDQPKKRQLKKANLKINPYIFHLTVHTEFSRMLQMLLAFNHSVLVTVPMIYCTGQLSHSPLSHTKRLDGHYWHTHVFI